MINPLDQLINRPFVYTMVFLRTPKCASSSLYSACGVRNLLCREKKSLEAALSKEKKYDGKFDVTHATPLELFRVFGRGIGNFFTFSCCRNPYEKAVSQWAFSVKNKFGQFYGQKNDPTFLEYCEFLYKNRHDKNYWSSILQTEYTHGCLNVDWVVRYEKLQESWADMLKTFDIQGLPITLPWANKNDHRPYQEYYCERSKEIILDVYGKDFTLLKYPTVL